MQFTVVPDVCLVDSPVEVRVAARVDQLLASGDSMAFALPESYCSLILGTALSRRQVSTSQTAKA